MSKVCQDSEDEEHAGAGALRVRALTTWLSVTGACPRWLPVVAPVSFKRFGGGTQQLDVAVWLLVVPRNFGLPLSRPDFKALGAQTALQSGQLHLSDLDVPLNLSRTAAGYCEVDLLDRPQEVAQATNDRDILPYTVKVSEQVAEPSVF